MVDERSVRRGYHEAGHAVVALYYGVDVTSASVKPSISEADEGAVGRVTVEYQSDKLTASVWDLMVATAGFEAEAEYLGVPELPERDVYGVNLSESRKIQLKCERIAKLFGLEVGENEMSDSEKALRHFARTASRQVLRSRWHIVKALAQALLDRETLTQAEIKELWEAEGGRQAQPGI